MNYVFVLAMTSLVYCKKNLSIEVYRGQRFTVSVQATAQAEEVGHGHVNANNC